MDLAWFSFSLSLLRTSAAACRAVLFLMLASEIVYPAHAQVTDKHGAEIFDACKDQEVPRTCYRERESVVCPGKNDVNCRAALGVSLKAAVDECLERQRGSDGGKSLPGGWSKSNHGLASIYWPSGSPDGDYGQIKVEFRILNDYLPWHTLAIELVTLGDHLIADGERIDVARPPRRLLDTTDSDYLTRPAFLEKILTAANIQVPLQNAPSRYANFSGGKAVWNAYLSLEAQYKQCGYRPVR